jgi:hypothetical protein
LSEAAFTILLLTQENQAADHLISRLLVSDPQLTRSAFISDICSATKPLLIKNAAFRRWVFIRLCEC